MVDIDHVEFNDDVFTESIGSDEAWELWAEGKTKWQSKRLKNGKLHPAEGWWEPVTGGYGKDMTTH